MPIVVQKYWTCDKPRSRTEFRLGDAAFHAYLTRDIDRNWAFAFGVRLEPPTAADALGNKKWLIMPGFGIRYSFRELEADTYFVPVIRYALSVAGDPGETPTQPNVTQE